MKKIYQKTAIALAIALAIGNAIAANSITRDIRVETIPANNSDKVELTLRVADGRDTIRIGDTTSFCFTASAPGYASLWDFGTSGKISRIYPYSEDESFTRLRPGQEACVGDGQGGTRFRITGPTGVNSVVLYWTQDEAGQMKANSYHSPRDFASGIASKAKDIVTESLGGGNYGGNGNNNSGGGWENWATAEASFKIINGRGDSNNDNQDDNGNINTSDLARTRGNYDNIYAIAFGANVGELKKTNDDARMFLDTMRASLNIPDANIKLYENAYRSDFEDGFAWLRDHASSNDLVLFFYSGHGTTLPDDDGDEDGDEDEALVPYDLAKEENINDPSKYIRDDQLKTWFDSLNAGAIVTVFDSCFSGGMYKGFSQSALLGARPKFFTKGKIAGKLPEYRGKSAKKKGPGDMLDGATNRGNKRVLLAASQEMEYAMEIPGSGGLFMTSLHDTLQNRGDTRDWQEMSDLLTRNVQRASDSKQNPTVIDPDHVLSSLKLD